MMRLLNNKHNVRTISAVIAVLFVVGIGALAYTQMASPAAAAGTDSSIGVVDTSKLFSENSAALQSASQELQTYRESLNKEFNEKAANLSDEEKSKLIQEYQAKDAAKKQEIQEKLHNQINEASKSVADNKSLTVVLDKSVVLYGGVDITDQVAKKLSSSTDSSK